MISIEKITANYWSVISEIYAAGIATGMATFEKTVPNYNQWDKKHLPHSRIVAIKDTKVVGWAALAPISNRIVYAGVAEVSIYIDKTWKGQGIAKLLLAELVMESEKHGIWSLQSSIFPENKASIAVHKSIGFRYIGKKEKIATLDNIWKDNLLFEKRSQKIGI